MSAAAVTQEELRQGRAVLALFRAIEKRRAEHPDETYAPSYPGQPLSGGRKAGTHANQLAFHKSTHPIRLLAPGNGWGKTTAAGAEANAWATHHQLWRKTPPWPVRILWFAKLFDQFELIRYQLQETVFTREVRYAGNTFTWPDGSSMTVASANEGGAWRKWQGVPVDLVIFDEQPPRQLWREMRVRRRARRKTEYVFAMTATEGESWVEEDLFRQWVEFHAERGLDPERALWAQLHPRIFCWHIGGIADNPGADQEDVEWAEEAVWSSEKERMVRLRGGFQRWVGDAIFDEGAMLRMEKAALALDEELGEGQIGFITWSRDIGEPNVPKYPKWSKPKFDKLRG